MPVFFFDTHNGDDLVRDTSGAELSDRAEARLQALDALGSMVKDELPDGDYRNLYINIRDSNGPIYTVCMSVTGRWLD